MVIWTGAKHQDILEFMFEFSTRDTFGRASGVIKPQNSLSGINLANVSRRRPKHLDRELMILWLQQRKAAGQSLRWTVVCLENRDHALAIRREFGNWRDAIDAAGVREVR